jgi:hypothetical protein
VVKIRELKGKGKNGRKRCLRYCGSSVILCVETHGRLDSAFCVHFILVWMLYL